MTGPRESQLLETVNLLLDARRTAMPIAALPPELAPTTQAEAVWIQDRLLLAFGEVGGWKVGASGPEATPLCGPMPRAWMAPNAAILSAPHFRYRGLEAEIAFLLVSDLPPRADPYTRAEALAAVASCHPAIEILESAFADPAATPSLHTMADLQNHGGFVHGPACPGWQTIDFTRETVTLAIDGSIRVERTGSNRAGDLLRLLPWLANQAARTGGLRAGQFITTGSWTGVTRATAGHTANARFTTAGRVSLAFA
jgi:2-keto-4-pentenoate hydratase